MQFHASSHPKTFSVVFYYLQDKNPKLLSLECWNLFLKFFFPSLYSLLTMHSNLSDRNRLVGCQNTVLPGNAWCSDLIPWTRILLLASPDWCQLPQSLRLHSNAASNGHSLSNYFRSAPLCAFFSTSRPYALSGDPIWLLFPGTFTTSPSKTEICVVCTHCEHKDKQLRRRRASVLSEVLNVLWLKAGRSRLRKVNATDSG